jgi:type II secretory pathway pseudopilin PulG
MPVVSLPSKNLFICSFVQVSFPSFHSEATPSMIPGGHLMLYCALYCPQRRATRQAGFNLIEAAIVLGIVGLIVGGIWAAAGSAYENMRQQNASKQLLALVQGIRGFYAQNPSDQVDEKIDNLYNLGILPADMVVDSSGTKTLRHPWGGTVIINDTTTSMGIPSFKVTFDDVSDSSCRNFITRASNVARGSGLMLINTGSTTYLDLLNNSQDINTSQPACADRTPFFFVFSLRG